MGSNVFDVLESRGFIQQVTDAPALRALFDAGPVTAYVGYDPTANSLHVGNLFSLMALKHLEMGGHRPLALLGGGTSMVGDPSGKTEMRQMLEPEQIRANGERIREQIGRILDVRSGKSLLVDNAEWLLPLKYVDFLRDIGRHFSVNRMLTMDSVKLRLEKGLSFLEFNYQLLQAYDYLELMRRYGCLLQMGGDDQWGNILAGVDLCRRVDHKHTFGLTVPLLLTAAGQKMGKTAQGALWLDAERVSPYEYYQYWVNTDDADVERLLGFYTFLPMNEIKAVSKLEGAQLNDAKSVLAYEATAVVHGAAAAAEARRAASQAFATHDISSELLPSSRIPRGVEATVMALPTLELTRHEVESGISVLDVLVRAGMCGSKNEARRKVTEGAVKLGDAKEKVQDIERVLALEDFVDGTLMLRLGQKKIHRLVLI